MQIVSAAVPPFFKNGFLVSCDTHGEAVLVDPGDEVDALLEEATRRQIRVVAILLTHAHVDHVTGVGRAKEALGAPVWLHRDDLFLYQGATEQARLFGFQIDAPPLVDAFYEPGTPIRFGECVVDILPTPGHCPGGVCLAIGPSGSDARELFVGDTLFAGSIGRTDLPGGDYETLMHSIREVLLAFPADTVVHPGHGPDTTIGVERRTNPFLAA
jgi:hydroxyacylglutathione hydrolase